MPVIAREQRERGCIRRKRLYSPAYIYLYKYALDDKSRSSWVSSSSRAMWLLEPRVDFTVALKYNDKTLFGVKFIICTGFGAPLEVLVFFFRKDSCCIECRIEEVAV